MLSIIIYAVGLVYGIFFLKEIKVPVTSEETVEPPPPSVDQVDQKSADGVDNMAFQDGVAPPAAAVAIIEPESINRNGQTNLDTPVPEDDTTTKTTTTADKKKTNFCLDFFDPTLALGCIQVVRKKRENAKHFIIWFLILSYIIIAGTAQGRKRETGVMYK